MKKLGGTLKTQQKLRLNFPFNFGLSPVILLALRNFLESMETILWQWKRL